MAVKTNTEVNGHKYFRTRLLIGYDSNGKKVYKTFYGKSQKEAESKLDDYKQDLKNGINANAGEFTLNKAFKDWLVNVILVSGIKNSTYETYDSIYRLYIKDSDIGIKKIKDIKCPVIQSYLNKLYMKGKKYTLLVKFAKLLKRFFNYQIEIDALIKNPCMGIKVPGQINYLKEINSREYEVFTETERDAILEYLYKYDVRIAGIAFLAFSLGMREGEILAISWDSNNPEDRILGIKKSIRKSTDYDEHGEKIGSSMKITIPKTMTSVREIAYTENYDLMWQRALAVNEADAEKGGTSFNNEHNLVFTDELGNPLLKRYVLRHWKKALEALNIPYRPFHCTRHTFITKMAINSVPESITQAIVGHKKGSEVTHKIYTHINKDDTKNVLKNYIINVPLT